MTGVRSSLLVARAGGRLFLRITRRSREFLHAVLVEGRPIEILDPQEAIALGEDLAREGRQALKHRAETATEL